MMAAITAAKQGARVVLVEKNIRMGKKLLATGNGRCNLSNTHIGDEESLLRYNRPDFVAPVLRRFDCDGVRAVFEELGLLTVVDKKGWVFPRTRTANSVVDVLVNEIERLGITAFIGQEATGVMAYDGGYRIDASGDIISAKSLVLACGVEPLLRSFAVLPMAAPQPVLGPLKTVPDPIRGLDGVRAVCRVLLTEGSEILSWQDGELLFRDYGVSGIAIFNLSRFARAGHVLSIDFFPEFSVEELESMLLRRCSKAKRNPAALVLTGMLHSRIIQAVLRMSKIRAHESLDAEKLKRLAYNLKAFNLSIIDGPPKEQAQVTRGGLVAESFNPATLEAIMQPRLFAAGECLDVDGPCGGYNLHWAWASGLVAGECGAKAALR